MTAARSEVVGRVADHLVAVRAGHPLLVAVDGVADGPFLQRAEPRGAVGRDRPPRRRSRSD